MNKDIAVSIIIPVLNESKIIPSLLDHLFSLCESEQTEIIIIDGSPDQDTLKAVPERPGIITKSSLRGRGLQMNSGALEAKGSILLFLHADSKLPENALGLIQKTCGENSAFKAGAFSLEVDSCNVLYRFWTAVARTRTAITRIPYGDQGIFLRKSYFDELGGYAEIPLMEDVDLMVRIKKRGDLIRILPERILTSPRRWEREGLIRGTLRNWKTLIKYKKGVPPEELEKYFRNGNEIHKK